MQKKFNINERLRGLPTNDAVPLRKTIASMMGKTREHVSRILNAPEDSVRDLPSEVIIRLANYFGCNPEDLYNSPPKPISQKELDLAVGKRDGGVNSVNKNKTVVAAGNLGDENNKK